MNARGQPLDRATAAEFAGWFKALADPTRVQIVSLLARRGQPMNVGEIVAAVDVGQSTVSAHLRILAEVRFILADPRGTATFYRINAACVSCFPTAAPAGLAYGLDASSDMLALARANAEREGVTNARFLPGRIEAIPLPDEHADVIISNCVVNLSADKARVLTEAFRVLRPGGRIGISDVIADQSADQRQRASDEQQAGCAAGTLTAAEYDRFLRAAGFTGISITPTAATGSSLHSAIIQAVRPVL
jgi:DNA-binding transcriptional ArsR family regulator